MADFTAAFANLVPSLTVADLDRYDKLQQQYAPERQRAKGVGGAAAGTPSTGAGPSGSSGSSSTLKLRPKLPPRRKASESYALDGV